MSRYDWYRGVTLWRFHFEFDRSCMQCGYGRDGGVHMPLAECERQMRKHGGCANPQEHHRFRWFRA